MKELIAPLSESTVRNLKLGDIVYISGPMITGRDEMHMRAMEYSELGKGVPKDINNSVLFHCGPIVVDTFDGWKIIAAGPTTSARMNSLEPDMIRKFRIRAIIGKGGMSEEVGKAMAEVGCVYLAAVGGAAVSTAETLKVTGVEWTDLGMAEAMWKMDAERLGPLIVAMDSNGGSLYDQVKWSLVRDI